MIITYDQEKLEKHLDKTYYHRVKKKEGDLIKQANHFLFNQVKRGDFLEFNLTLVKNVSSHCFMNYGKYSFEVKTDDYNYLVILTFPNVKDMYYGGFRYYVPCRSDGTGIKVKNKNKRYTTIVDNIEWLNDKTNSFVITLEVLSIDKPK